MTLRPSPASTIDLSNALTYGSLFAGVCAVAAALQGNAPACGLLLATAVLFDTFDGRFARLIRRSRPAEDATPLIGEQLDSLVDAVTFGMVPVVCASVLFRVDGPLWWIAAFVYVACAVTRLGYFNISHEHVGGFIGLPAPVAALCWSSVFLLEPGNSLVIVIALTSAVAMIAPLPVPRPAGAGLALFVAWPLALIAIHSARLLA